MQEHYTPKGKHLTIDNRRLIEWWKNENKSNREIAGLLGKAPQTIHNEVKRGTTLQQVRKGLYKKVYSAIGFNSILCAISISVFIQNSSNLLYDNSLYHKTRFLTS
ncbi:transposase-like protein%2C IS1239 [Streptococcus pneumoniae]|nr:transposase-like protein%2C IS1239 [Streptococcus pneumoniae]